MSDATGHTAGHTGHTVSTPSSLALERDGDGDSDGFDLVTVDRARMDRLETLAEWVDTLLLPNGQTVMAMPPDEVLRRIREVAERCPATEMTRGGGLVSRFLGRAWRARRPFQGALRVGQVALVLIRIAIAYSAIARLLIL